MIVILHETGGITSSAAIVILSDGLVNFHIINFLEPASKVKNELHIANFSVLTAKQMKTKRHSVYLAPNENEEQATHLVSSLLRATEAMINMNKIGFRQPKNPRNEQSHVPIQELILHELQALQEAENLNPRR